MKSSALGVALAALFLPPTPASAATHQPKGQFAPFAECPLEVPTLTDCIHTRSDAGKVTIGTRTVSLARPLIVQGGAEGAGEEVTFHSAANGETLVAVPQPVPGGLGAVKAPTPWPKWLQEWFNEGMQEGGGKVTATIELASPQAEVELDTENLLLEEGTALGLPVRIRLSGPLLGSGCQLGSVAEPVQLEFTTGKSGQLQGSPGKTTLNKESTVSTINDGRLVDGTYELPHASGCGGLLSYYLDPMVDILLGLPSSSGTDTAVIDGQLQDASAEAVRASE